MKQGVADLVGAEVLQAAEAILYILDEAIGVLGVELLQCAAQERVGRVGKSDESLVVASNCGCIHHPLYMVNTTSYAAEVFERIPGSSPEKGGFASMQKYVSSMRKEHIWGDMTADHEVIVEVNVVFTKVRDAPEHSFDA